MGINCKISKNKDGTIDYVEGNDGKRSELYDDLRLIFGDQKALDYLAVTESENFKKRYPNFEYKEGNINNISINKGSISQELIDRLKQNGLSEDVFLMSTEDIDAKLEELGVSDDVRKQVADYVSGYYSNASTAFSNLKDKNVKNVQGWMKALTDVQKNGGIKNVNQELEWIGLEDYLNEYVKENNPKAGNIPSSVVEDYIKSNQIEIIDVKKQDYLEPVPLTFKKLNQFDEDDYGSTISSYEEIEEVYEDDEVGYQIVKTDEGFYVRDERTDNVYRDNNYENNLFLTFEEAVRVAGLHLADKNKISTEGTKYEGYQLKGGENYREVLLTMPPKKVLKFKSGFYSPQYLKEQEDLIQELKSKGYTVNKEGEVFDLEGNNIPYGENKIPDDIEEFIDNINYEAYYTDKEFYETTEEGYRSSHWSEENILAHVRLNEKTLPDGRKVLILNEIQSDFSQDIRKGKTLLKSPYANTDQWVGLVTRRVMQMASQEGYDGIAFATGQQSADMYSLSQQVDKIDISPQGDVKAVYISMKNNADDAVFINQEGVITESASGAYNGKQAEEVLGKDLTRKILETEEETTLEGEGLEFGGEGMKTFYDKIVPKVIQKEAQRIDKNAKLETIDFSEQPLRVTTDEDGNRILVDYTGEVVDAQYGSRFTTDQEYIDAFKDAYNNSKGVTVNKDDKLSLGVQPYLPLTQGIKDSVSQGIPQFQKALNKVGIDMIVNGFVYKNQVFLNKDVASNETAIHEFSHLFNSWLKENRKELYNKGIDLVKNEINNTTKTAFSKQAIDKENEGFIQDFSVATIKGKEYQFLKADNVFYVEVDGIGEIAKATLNKEGYLDNIRVNENYRRMGVGSALYDYIEEIKGIKLKPSPIKISKEAQSLWEKRNENSKIQDIISYVRTTQPDLKGEALAEEILAELTGKRGAELLNSKKKSGIIDWIREAFKEIGKMLGLLEATPEQISKMTLEDFADASAVQMLKGNSIKDVIEFANSTEESLSKKETEEALDTAIALGVSNNYELDTVLRQAFLENGMVVFDRQKLKKAGFNDYEISKIMSEQNQTKISDLVYKLRNTEFVVESDDSNIQYGSETTIFGKQKPITEAVEKGVFEIVNGEISEKKSDTKQTLRKTYPLQPKPYNTKPFLAIQTLKDNVAQRNESDVKKVLEKIKDVAFDYGVDLRGIENKIYPIENLKKFITSLERYFNNPNDSFADDYDSFFDISLPSPQAKVNEVELDTELSEYELFRDFNLVRKEGNVYTKVKPESLENIRNYFFQQQSELKSPEEVQTKLSELELEDFEIDGDTVEKMYMWKKFLNYPVRTVSNMKPDFIDISELRENPYKKVTSNGVKLKNNDNLTKAKSELYETSTEKRELDLDDNNRRKELLNNKFAIEKIKTDYSFIEDGVLMTKNNPNDFVRTPLGVFEKVFEYGNLSFYTETTSENLELTDADFSKHFSQAQEVENIVEAKNYYTKKEIEEINNKYFGCK